MGAENYNYRITSGTRGNGDLSSSAAVVAAITGVTLSLKRVIWSASAAGVYTIERADGTDLVVVNLGANGGAVMEFAPGQLNGSAGAAINALASVTGSAFVYVECYALAA